MKKNLLVLFSLLIVASMMLAACGDIGNPPAEYPTTVTACNHLSVEGPETVMYLINDSEDWNATRSRIMWDFNLDIGECP
jgi:hypothetical protein